MEFIRSSRVSVAVGVAALSTSMLGFTPSVEAAKFPTQSYFWLDNYLDPVSYVPWSNYSVCKVRGDFDCTINVTRKSYSDHFNGDVGFNNLYEIALTPRQYLLDTLIFATAYGEARGNPPYCTSGGTVSDDSFVNCNKQTPISVRLVGNDSNTPGGTAAFGQYLWFNPTATFNSSGRTNTVTPVYVNGRLQTGVYKVRIPLGETQSRVSDSIAHVQAVQPPIRITYQQKRICNIHSLSKRSTQVSTAAEMEVRCYGRDESDPYVGMGGSTNFTLVDAPFNYIYEFQEGADRGLIRSVWSDELRNDIYRPQHSSHSNITVQRTGEGRYNVHLPNTRATKTNVQVTAQGSDARWCNVLSWTAAGNGTDVKLACYVMTRNGAVPTNSRFFLGYYYERM